MTSIPRQLRNRRAVACRLPDGDPWTAALRAEDAELTPKKLEAWASAANWIGSDGNTPILPLSVLRALYGKGGARRELAERIYRAGGYAA